MLCPLQIIPSSALLAFSARTFSASQFERSSGASIPAMRTGTSWTRASGKESWQESVLDEVPVLVAVRGKSTRNVSPSTTRLTITPTSSGSLRVSIPETCSSSISEQHAQQNRVLACSIRLNIIDIHGLISGTALITCLRRCARSRHCSRNFAANFTANTRLMATRRLAPQHRRTDTAITDRTCGSIAKVHLRSRLVISSSAEAISVARARAQREKTATATSKTMSPPYLTTLVCRGTILLMTFTMSISAPCSAPNRAESKAKMARGTMSLTTELLRYAAWSTHVNHVSMITLLTIARVDTHHAIAGCKASTTLLMHCRAALRGAAERGRAARLRGIWWNWDGDASRTDAVLCTTRRARKGQLPGAASAHDCSAPHVRQA